METSEVSSEMELGIFLKGIMQPQKSLGKESLELCGQISPCTSPRSTTIKMRRSPRPGTICRMSPRPLDIQPNAGTHFTQDEGDELFSILAKIIPNKLETPTNPIDFETFRVIMKTLSLSRYFMMDRVFQAFDHDGDGKLSPTELIDGLSTFLRGNLEDQIQFAFKVYDNTRKGFLTHENVVTCLTDSFSSKKPNPSYTTAVSRIKNNPEEFSEMINGLVNLVFPKLDVDGDGKISFNDFRSACVKDPTLLESLGPCLPKDCACHNAHRVSPQGEGSNSSNYIDFLTKISLASGIMSTPSSDKAFANNRILSPIDLKQ